MKSQISSVAWRPFSPIPPSLQLYLLFVTSLHQPCHLVSTLATLLGVLSSGLESHLPPPLFLELLSACLPPPADICISFYWFTVLISFSILTKLFEGKSWANLSSRTYRKCWINACWNYLISLRNIVSLLKKIFLCSGCLNTENVLGKEPRQGGFSDEAASQTTETGPLSAAHPAPPAPSVSSIQTVALKMCHSQQPSSMRAQSALGCWVTVSSYRGYVVCLAS